MARELVDRALAGDPGATRSLVELLLPVIRVRVARVLVRRGGRSGRDARQETPDLVQEVFLALFAEDGRALRAWDPSRGLSLESFCGLLAEREAASILRSGKRSPWREDATEDDMLDREAGSVSDAEGRVASREELGLLVERVRESVSPRGLELFQRLLVEEEPVEAVCSSTGMTADAVYAWKSRLGKLVRKLAGELLGPPQSDSLSSDRSAPPRRSSRTPDEPC